MNNIPYGAVLAIWIWCAICSQPMFGFMMFFPRCDGVAVVDYPSDTGVEAA